MFLLTETARKPTATAGPARRCGFVAAYALGAVLTAAAVVFAQPHAPDGPTRPAPRDGAWLEMHESFLQRAKAAPVDLLFLGDSITQCWRNVPPLWDRYYGPRHAANFGIGGDRTQHLLWRIDHGELDGVAPKVVVVLIGTNNLDSSSPAEVAEGVTAVVERVREKLPRSKVLLLGLFPRGKKPQDAARIRLEAVNARLARLDDGKSVAFLDIGPHLVNEDGTISQDVMPDFLHLSERGYRIWADAMEPKLWEMLEGVGK